MKPDYFYANSAKEAETINEKESGWYFCLPLEEQWYGPFATKGEASTEFQTLMNELEFQVSNLKYAKDHISAELIETSTDTFGTRTLKILIHSSALNEDVEVIVVQDKGSWIEPVSVLKFIVDKQINEETESNGGAE